LVGRKYPIYRFKTIANGKSIGGSISFFITTFIICYFMLPFDNILLVCFTISLLSSIVELICSRGFDNLFIPLSCYLIFFFLK
jgi:phytol kinase